MDSISGRRAQEGHTRRENHAYHPCPGGGGGKSNKAYDGAQDVETPQFTLEGDVGEQGYQGKCAERSSVSSANLGNCVAENETRISTEQPEVNAAGYLKLQHE